MNRTQSRFKLATHLTLGALMLLLAFGTYSFAQGQRYKSGNEWSFGVMGDTQWTLGRAAYSPALYGNYATKGYVYQAQDNPNFISESIGKQARQAMISHGVKFVFQMGDASNWGGVAAIETNAGNVHDLFSAGIGYFPMRGNHESYSWMMGDFELDENGNYVLDADGNRIFHSYDPYYNYNIPEWRAAYPQTRGEGEYLFGARNFSSPARLIPFDPAGEYAIPEYVESEDLKGLSYSFDFGPQASDARFVIMDFESTGWVFPEGQSAPTASNYAPAQQQKWISDRLNIAQRGTAHAFVLAHRQPMGQNHRESLFGGFDPNPFFASLQQNEVKYYISAHDHMYHRSIVASPDLQNHVTQIITTGLSTKYYSPAALDDEQKAREIPLAQELKNVGYYIYNVDGPRVTVDYYSDATGNLGDDYCFPYVQRTCSSKLPTGTPVETPKFDFVKKESFGYSLNGLEFLVAQGESYTNIRDKFRGTEARILNGINNSAAQDASPVVVDDNGTPEDVSDDTTSSWPRPFVKAVNTGWTEKTADKRFMSDMLSLWGMADFGSEMTDVFALSIKHDFRKAINDSNGNAGIAALKDGKWINAVSLNMGEDNNPRFVKGAYNPAKHGLGSYGIDPKSKSAWAVLDYNADFVVMEFADLPVAK